MSSNNYSRDHHSRKGALRAQLDSFIHRHSRAEFHVHLIIHELSSVPLLDGDFGVKWKFRGVMNPKVLNNDSSKRKGKEKERSAWLSSPRPTDSDLHRVHSRPSRPTDIMSHSPLSVSPTQSMVSLPSSTSSSAPSRAAASSSCHSHPSNSIDSEPDSPKSSHFHSHDRGITPFLPLRDHKIAFEHSINVMLQMYVDNSHTPSEQVMLPGKNGGGKGSDGNGNSKGKLKSSPLKLVIRQRVAPNDPDAPNQPRLGAVYLDLAEYAEPTLGPVTRKYLLAESRTNAILKLTIHITPHSVPTNGFIAPPLPPPTIQSSLATLLKPRMGTEYRSTPTPVTHSYSKFSPPTSFLNDLNHRIPNLHSPSVETRDIIEAIFNPVPTSNPNPSPFTFYIAPPATSPLPTGNLPEIIPRYAHSEGSGAEKSHARPLARRAVSTRSKSSLSNELFLADEQDTTLRGDTPMAHRVLRDTENTKMQLTPPRPSRSPAQASFSSLESDHVPVEEGKDKNWWKRLGQTHGTTSGRSRSPASR